MSTSVIVFDWPYVNVVEQNVQHKLQYCSKLDTEATLELHLKVDLRVMVGRAHMALTGIARE